MWPKLWYKHDDTWQYHSCIERIPWSRFNMHPANKGHYNVTWPLIGCAHAQNDPYIIDGVNQKLETAPIVLWDKYSTVLKLWQFVMTETYESWLSLENSCIYYVRQNHEIYQVLPNTVDYRSPRELWNPLCKAVLNKCNFIWNEWPVNIWNDCKTQK